MSPIELSWTAKNNKTFNNRKDNIIFNNKTFVQIDTQPALPAQPEYEYEEDVLPNYIKYE